MKSDGENIYKLDIKDLKLSEKEKRDFKKHEIKQYPVWACIVFHFITFGLFTLIYFGLKHGKLPKIRYNDPGTGKAIGFMFIPFFNLYWGFFFWLRLIDRINFQYKLRGKSPALDNTLAILAMVLMFVPFINYISAIILYPIMAGQIQSASNRLVALKD